MVSESRTDVVNESFISRMTRLYIEINGLGERVGEMPEDAMDCITDASIIVSRSIINAPVKTEADIAGKLRFAAMLVEYPDGVMAAEETAAQRAVDDLIQFREAEWAEIRAGRAS